MTPQVNPHIVNAFCHQGQGGNGAGVVLNADTLTRQQKLHIATKVGLSETAFVSKSSCADFKIEYFTPVDQVQLCGHATIATFVLLRAQGLAARSYTIETLSGVLTVQVSPDGTVWMQQCLPTFHQSYQPEALSHLFANLPSHPTLPIQVVSTGLKDILLPVASVQQLHQLQPHFEAMAAFSQRQDVVGIHAFAITGRRQPVAVCRNFAPRFGIDEECATGTSNCALACYLHRYHKPLHRYQFLQGLTMSRPSAVEVRLETDGNQINRVLVGGVGSIL